jgi:hypothetical protein
MCFLDFLKLAELGKKLNILKISVSHLTVGKVGSRLPAARYGNRQAGGIRLGEPDEFSRR